MRAYKKAVFPAIIAAAVTLSACTYGLMPAQNSSQGAAESAPASSVPLVDFNTVGEASSSEVSSSEASSSEEVSAEQSGVEESSSKAASSKTASSKAASAKTASSKAASSQTVSKEVIASSASEPYIFLVYKTDSSGVCKITLKSAGSYQITSAAVTEASNTIAPDATLNFSIDKTVLTATATGAGVFKVEITAESTADGRKLVLNTTVKAYQD